MRLILTCLTLLFVSTNATEAPAGTMEPTIDLTRSEPAEGVCLQVTLPSTGCENQMTLLTTTGQFAQGTCADTTECTSDTSSALAPFDPLLTSCPGSSVVVYCPPVPPIGIDWVIPLSPDTITASIGDKLKFSWSGMGHNVYTMASSTCDFTGQSEITGGDTAMTGDVEYEITSLPLFFGCQVSGHCAAGQKLTVGCAQSLPGTAPTNYTFATGATVNAMLELTGVSCANGNIGTAVATCSTEASVTLSGCTVDPNTFEPTTLPTSTPSMTPTVTPSMTPTSTPSTVTPSMTPTSRSSNAASDSSVSKMVVTFSFVATLFLMM